VRQRSAPAAEKMKRLTIDVPLSLHTKLKTACAESEKKIADVVRGLIADHVANHPKK
jgi:ParG